MAAWEDARDAILAVLGSDCVLLLFGEDATSTNWNDSSAAGNDVPGVNTPTPNATGYGANSRGYVDFDPTVPEYYAKTSGFSGIAAQTPAVACIMVATPETPGTYRGTIVDIKAGGDSDYIFRQRQNLHATNNWGIPRWHAFDAAGSTELVGTQALSTTGVNYIESWASDTDGLVHTRLNSGTDDSTDVADSGGMVTTKHAATRCFVGHTSALTAGFQIDGKIAFVCFWKNNTAEKQAHVLAIARSFYDGRTGAFAQSIAVPTLATTGGPEVAGTMSATIAVPSLSAAGAVLVAGTLSQTIAVPTIAATSTVENHGDLTQTIAVPSLSASGISAIAGAMSATIAVPVLAATGAVLVTGALAQTIAAPTIVAAGTVVDPIDIDEVMFVKSTMTEQVVVFRSCLNDALPVGSNVLTWRGHPVTWRGELVTWR